MSDEANNDQEPQMVHFKKVANRRTGGNRTNFSTDMSDEPPVTPNSAAVALNNASGGKFFAPEPVATTIVPLPGGPAMPSAPPPGPLRGGPPPLQIGGFSGPSVPPSPATPLNSGGIKLPPGAVAMLPMVPPPTPSNSSGGPPPMRASVDQGHTSFSASSLPPLPAQASVPPQYHRQPTILQPRGEVQYDQQESSVYKALENGVAVARQNITAAKNPSFGQQTDSLTGSIPSLFVPNPTVIPPAQPNKDHVFLCGPIGSCQPKKDAKDLKDLKPRWAVLCRDRVEIYSKFGDSKPSITWPLVDCLVQGARDAESRGFITLTTVKGDNLVIRAEHGSATNTPTNLAVSTPLKPIDLENAHRAWLNALKTRSAYNDYMLKCKTNSVHPDERLIHLYDAQFKAPNAMHLIISNATAELYSRLPPIPGVYINQNGKYPSSDLPFEGFCIDLQGAGAFQQDPLSRLAGLLSDPDSLPVFGVKFGSGIDLGSTESILMSLASNTNSGLLQLDLSGADCLSPEVATPTNERLLDLLTKFLTSPNLTKFNNLTLRQSDLTTAFMISWTQKLQSSPRPIIAPLSVVDLSSNKLDNGAILALVGLFAHNETISSNLEHLNLSWNTFSELDQLSTWLTLHKPTSSSYTLHQQVDAPFKPIKLQGLYLQGCSSLTDKEFVKLAKALLWHVSLTTLDCSQCMRLQDPGTAALVHAVQINQSITNARFNNHKLTLQGLTALRLFYRFGAPQQNADLFGDDYSQFSLVGLASESGL